MQDIAALLWPCVAVYAVWRGAQVAERFAPHATMLDAGEDDDVVVPDDLLALATMEQSAWAQEDVLRVIKERYADLKDWNRVRMAMGIGEVPR